MKRLPRDNEEALDQYWEGKWQDGPEEDEEHFEDDGRVFWCNAHERVANDFDSRDQPACDSRLGGILLPCRCVELTGIAELFEDPSPPELRSLSGWKAAELRVVCQVRDCAAVMQEGVPGAPVSHSLCPACEPVFIQRMEEEFLKATW